MHRRPWTLIATTNPGKIREIRGILGGRSRRSPHAGRPAPIRGARGDRRHLRGERAAEGALLLGGDRTAQRRGRLRPRDRRARQGTRRPLRALARLRLRSEVQEDLRAAARAQGSQRARRGSSPRSRLPRTAGSRSRSAAWSRERSRRSRRGRNGFGYDPIFFYPPLGRTLGEVDGDAKATVEPSRRRLSGVSGLPSAPASLLPRPSAFSP